MVVKYLLIRDLVNLWVDIGSFQKVISEVDDVCSLALALVDVGISNLFVTPVTPVLDRRVPLDSELLGKIRLSSGVNFAEFDLALEGGSRCVPLRLEVFAMTTPGGVELDEPDVSRV